jgi:hypothetical protein
VYGATVRVQTAHDGLRFDTTGPAGHYAVGDLFPGVVTLTVAPPPGQSALLSPAPMTVIVPSSTPITLTFEVADKQVTGWVHTNDNVTVTNALVNASRVGRYGYDQAMTDASGVYTLTLAPGLWEVKVHPISITAPANRVFPSPARTVMFDNNKAPQQKTVNFVVYTEDATVSGKVQLPGGSPPPFTITVSLHTDDGIDVSQLLDGSGHYSLKVPHGMYLLDLHVQSDLFAALPTRWIYARALTPTVVPTITLLARDAIIIGSLTDLSGTAVSGVPVIAWNTATNATFGSRSRPDGVYVTPVYSGTWLVRPAPLPDQPYVYIGDPTQVSLVAGQIDGHVNFTMTNATATIHGVLLDSNGQPVNGVSGWARADSQDGKWRTGAPVVDDAFDILVPAGSYTVTLQLPAGQDFLAPHRPPISRPTACTRCPWQRDCGS